MNRHRWLGAAAAALLALLTLSGCSSGAGASTSGAEDGRYEIAFATSPAELKLNESVTLSVAVSRGGKPVKDADVVLELWPKGVEPSEHAQLSAKADGKGSYVLKGQFSQAGVYYVISHVTPKETGQMTMAGFEFEIVP
ncbi:FixH family protein [Cohnella thermotolerans]|uniref:FixH family protein n=1 Tax=Cohnella thermotolerans TaxID=329858 RepID=UPI0003FEFC6D|nr:FixH family protein [Cohnella thermotolerans]